MNFVTGFCALMMMSTLYMRIQTLNIVDIMLIRSVYVNEPLLNQYVEWQNTFALKYGRI